jgi:hypothetical protein
VQVDEKEKGEVANAKAEKVQQAEVTRRVAGADTPNTGSLESQEAEEQMQAK